MNWNGRESCFWINWLDFQKLGSTLGGQNDVLGFYSLARKTALGLAHELEEHNVNRLCLKYLKLYLL